jgi:hypothetical protein
VPLESAMRSTPQAKPTMPAAKGEGESVDVPAGLNEMLDRIAAERAACEKLGDAELMQRAGRNVLTAVACAADAVLADATTLHSAPDKIAAFFDKSAAAYVAAIEGLHKRAALMAASAGDVAAGGMRAADSRLDDYAVWGPPKTS